MAEFSKFTAPYLRTAFSYFQYFYSFEILIGQSLQKVTSMFLTCVNWHVIFASKCNKIEKRKT